jgi:hypothetical protein
MEVSATFSSTGSMKSQVLLGHSSVLFGCCIRNCEYCSPDVLGDLEPSQRARILSDEQGRKRMEVDRQRAMI